MHFAVCLFSREYVRDKTFLGCTLAPYITDFHATRLHIYVYMHIYTRSLNESEYRSGIAALETRVTKSEIQYRGCVFPLFSIRLCFPLSFSLLLSLFNFVYFIYFFSPFLLYTYINSTGSKLIFMQIRAFKARGFFVH